MKAIYVLYDEDCGFCRRCAWWLARQKQQVRLILWPRGCAAAQRTFGGLLATAEPDEMLVITDDGAVYRGTKGYVMCLWALRGYRRWAKRLARPALRPMVRGAFEWVARHRGLLSTLLGCTGDAEAAARLRDLEPMRCATVAPDASGELLPLNERPQSPYDSEHHP
ncbi:MAG: DUF393 domain-containing protein [Planctomycetes bacterium]|nr:DUF393 domain-containing protein [Planctomycetota bacterium]